MEILDRFHGCLLGLACGDAVGTTVEFSARGTFKPVMDMVGGGPFDLKPGQWTDDTSMALCLATSLAETGRFDARDQMLRYCRWMDQGYLSSTDDCFDIGTTVEDALQRFKESGEAFSGSTNPRAAGNGCLMRLAPIPMYFFSDRELALKRSADSARTTHGAPECIDASKLFGAILHRALGGADKDAVLGGHGVSDAEISSASVRSIAKGTYLQKSEVDIRGTGYVVDSLEAALWCFATTTSFKSAILKAANLGDDADTTAAICGQVAGAFYGIAGIPKGWLDVLAMADEIRSLAGQLAVAK
jgi:ADP-ribosyl-[dinitrogen reductase] hydrolase